MKSRKTLHIVLVIIGIAIFIASYLIITNTIAKPLNTTELNQCKEIAQIVSRQSDKTINDILEESDGKFKIIIKRPTTIIIRPSFRTGMIKAKLNNDNPMFIQNKGIGASIGIGIFFGILFTIIYALICYLVFLYYPKT